MEIYMRILFMGTPDIAAACLEKLVTDGYDVVGAVCRADKEKGRGHKLMPPEVKKTALLHGIPVFQPESLKHGELMPWLEELKPDVIVVVAYGRILPPEVIEFPRYGCLNMHASKLPKYRGAAPIQRAVMNGDEITAATVMKMDNGLDTGDILAERIIKIEPEETSGSLFEKMIREGAELLCETLRNIDGITPRPQEGEPVYAHMITKETAHICWSDDAEKICRLVRAMNPAPLAWCVYEGENIKICEAEAAAECGECGKILRVSPEGILIGAGRGSVLIKALRAPGKKTMSVRDYIRGNTVTEGVILA